MNSTLNCSKCGGAMQEGFLLDSGAGIQMQSRWLEGKPEHSRQTGIFLKNANIKTKDRKRLAVTTYRCETCGFLESYASDKGEATA